MWFFQPYCKIFNQINNDLYVIAILIWILFLFFMMQNLDFFSLALCIARFSTNAHGHNFLLSTIESWKFWFFFSFSKAITLDFLNVLTQYKILSLFQPNSYNLCPVASLLTAKFALLVRDFMTIFFKKKFPFVNFLVGYNFFWCFDIS